MIYPNLRLLIPSFYNHFLMHEYNNQHGPNFRTSSRNSYEIRLNDGCFVPRTHELPEFGIKDLIDIVHQHEFIHPDVPTPWIIHVYYGIMSASRRSLREGGFTPKQIPDLAWQTFTSIVTTYCVVADVLKACGYEWALVVLVGLGDIPPLSVSHFNRRLHEVGEWLPYLA